MVERFRVISEFRFLKQVSLKILKSADYDSFKLIFRLNKDN